MRPVRPEIKLRRPTAAPAKPALPRARLFAGIGDIISELKKVVWPSRHDATHLTTMVILVSVAMGLILGLIDLVFTWLVGDVMLRGR